jgi:hypothetical protein
MVLGVFKLRLVLNEFNFKFEISNNSTNQPEMFEGVSVAAVADGGQELVVGGGVIEGLRVAEPFARSTVRCGRSCLVLVFGNPGTNFCVHEI